jgi:hypothetical protein
LPKRRFGSLQRVERLAALCVVHRAGLRQAELAAGPVQQPRTEVSFELGDMLAGHRSGHGEARRGAGKAASLDHFPENAKAGQTIHLWFLVRK